MDPAGNASFEDDAPKATPTQMRATARALTLSLNIDLHLIVGVIQIAARIPDCGFGLYATLAVGGPREDYVVPAPRGFPGVSPQTPRIPGMVFAELRRIPRCAAVGRNFNLGDVGFARPRYAFDFLLARPEFRSVAWASDQRFHRQSGDGVCVLRLNRFARFYRRIGQTIAGSHEVSFRRLVEHSDFRKPLARRPTCPSWSDDSRRKTVMRRQWGAIHLGRNQSVGIDRFFNGNAAYERRDFAGNFVESAEHDILAGILDARFLQKNLQTRTREFRIADCAFAPLNPRNFRALQ